MSNIKSEAPINSDFQVGQIVLSEELQATTDLPLTADSATAEGYNPATQGTEATTDAQQTLEQCQICGQTFEEVHACLQAVPSSLLTLHDPRIGSVVVDHYILEEFVFTSDTSMVYRARHQLLNTHVAVKISTVAAEQDSFSILRTSRAALIAVRLDHPNIVRCIDFSHETRNAVLVMEWAHGTPLSQIIARELSLQPLRAVHLLEGLCDGLLYAQAQGINHINLKPSGILVDQTNGYEQIRLLDFGLMKMLGPHTLDAMLNSEHLKYSSPEERAGLPPDQRSMIYSLGLIFFDMLTGRVEALDCGMEVNAKMDVPALVKICPEMKEADILDGILSKCLECKPAQRFQSIEDLSRAVNETKVELERMERADRLTSVQDLAKTPGQFQVWMILLVMATLICMFFAFHNLLALH